MDLREIFINQPEMKELLLRSAIGLEKENYPGAGGRQYRHDPSSLWQQGHPSLYHHGFFRVPGGDRNRRSAPIPTRSMTSWRTCTTSFPPRLRWRTAKRNISGPSAIRPLSVARRRSPWRNLWGRPTARRPIGNIWRTKYGKKIMLYCGIHYNFSFDRDLIRRLHQVLGRYDDPQYLQSDLYLMLAKNCYLYSWFPVVMDRRQPHLPRELYGGRQRGRRRAFPGLFLHAQQPLGLLE